MAQQIHNGTGSSETGETNMQPNPGGSPPPNGDDIIVTGRFYESPYFYQWVVWGWAEHEYYAGFAQRYGYCFPEYESALLLPPPTDEETHQVTSTIKRELSNIERVSYDKFLGEVAAADKLIASLPDDAIVKMPSGKDITGAELKQIWSKTDFIINDNDHQYKNGTFRGEADFNNGDPLISFNIDYVDRYVRNQSAESRGGLWVIFHELGHLSDYGRQLNEIYDSSHNDSDRVNSERYADDFAPIFTEHYTGTHVGSDVPDFYSAQQGSIEFPINSEPPQNGYIPFWKFDSFDGTGLEVIA